MLRWSSVFRITKQKVREKKDAVGFSCLEDESGAVKVWMIKRKSGWSIWKS